MARGKGETRETREARARETPRETRARVMELALAQLQEQVLIREQVVIQEQVLIREQAAPRPTAKVSPSQIIRLASIPNRNQNIKCIQKNDVWLSTRHFLFKIFIYKKKRDFPSFYYVPILFLAFRENLEVDAELVY
jgi:hypothetical protein